MLRTISIFSLLTLLMALAATAATAAEKQQTAGQHDITHNSKPLMRYMHAYDTTDATTVHNTYKVYHHVLDADGKQPITKGPGGKFTHHRGIFVGFARMGYNGKTYDLWHMKGNARQIHQKFLEQKTGDDQSSSTTLIHWNVDTDKTAIEEKRTVTVHHTDDKAHLLCDWTSELKAVGGDVLLKGDPEHAGVQYRPHNDVVSNKSAKYTFHKDDIDPKTDTDLPWVAMTYELNGQKYTVQHMRHPSNPTGSVYSAYRDYGRFGNYFVKPVKEGETLKLQYRFRITTGDAPSREALQAEYARYVK